MLFISVNDSMFEMPSYCLNLNELANCLKRTLFSLAGKCSSIVNGATPVSISTFDRIMPCQKRTLFIVNITIPLYDRNIFFLILLPRVIRNTRWFTMFSQIIAFILLLGRYPLKSFFPRVS